MTGTFGRLPRKLERAVRFGLAGAILIGSLGVMAAPAAAADIVVGGSISSDTTWTAGNVYVVLSHVQVQSGVTLTIEAGVIVKFDMRRYLDVFGTLVLEGSPDNEVIFTSLRDDSVGGDTNGDLNSTEPAPGDWEAIYLENGLSTFHDAVVRYSARGLSVYNVTGTTLSPEIANNAFVDNIYGSYLYMGAAGGVAPNMHDNAFAHNTFGVVVSASVPSLGTATPLLTNNHFNNHTGFPIYLAGTAFPTYSGNTFTTNAHPAIALGGAFRTSGTWTVVDNMPFVVIGNTSVNAGAVVTVPVGAIIKFDRGKYLSVSGTLDLQSTAVTSPTVFTSFWDDAYGGDTNGDGLCPACTLGPAPGDWNAVYLESSTTVFEHSVVRFAERGVWVYHIGAGDFTPVVSNNVFDRNQYGLYLYSSGAGKITSQVMTNTFSNTTSGFPIYLDGTAYPLYGGNTFSNNLHPAIGVGGVFKHSGSWPLVNDMPYVVDGNTTLTTTATLTLPVGTVVKFAPGRYLNAYGTLIMQSSGATVPTVFTSYKDDAYAGDTNGDGGATLPARGDWDGVYLGSSGTQFDFAVVKYADHGLSVYNTTGVTISPPITSTTFTDNVYGVYLYAGNGNIGSLIRQNTFFSNTYGLGTATNGPGGGTSYPVLQSNSFNSHSGFPLYLGGSAFPVYISNTFSSNIHPAIGLGGNFNASGAWTLVNNMPYVVVENTRIKTGAVISLPINTVLKFELTKYLGVSGTLNLLSTGATAPIVFTSYRDDTVAGDTNADGGATQPARGDWDAIYLEANGTTIDYATVKYSTHGVDVYTACSCDLLSPTIISNTFTENTYGVFLYAGRNFITSLIQNNTFTNNTYGLGTATDDEDGYTSFPTLRGNSFSQHSGFPIYLGGSAFPTYISNTFASNVHPAIALGGWFNDSGSWPIINNMPYVILDDVFINLAASVNVPAGEVLKFDSGRYLHVFGPLNLQSTGATAPVIFTSYRDDAHAGDTNADGSATVPAAADWKSVWLYGAGTVFDYAVVKYSTAGVSVYYEGPANTNLFPEIAHNSLIQNLVGALLAIGYDSQTPGSGQGNITSLIHDNTFDANGYGLATYAHPSSSGAALPTLADNAFTNHSGLPIYLGGTGYPVYSGTLTLKQVGQKRLTSGSQPAPVLPAQGVDVMPSRAQVALGQLAPALEAAGPPTLVTGNVFAGNTHPAIGLAGSFNGAGTLANVANMPYVVVGNFPVIVNGLLATADVRIGANASVSLPPGAVVKLDSARYLDVFGDLDLLGTPSLPVLFTSYKDDTAGGDTNADGAGSSPARGDWRAIYLEGSNTLFEHAVVKYAAEGVHIYYAGPGGSSIYPEVSSSYFLENTVGLSFRAHTNGDVTSSIHGNVFVNNGTHMLGTTGSGNGRLLITVTDNDLYGSSAGPMGFNHLSTASTITATMNWWGHDTGPYHPTLNAGGQGAPVSDYVDFSPWRGSPSQGPTTYSIQGRVTNGDPVDLEPIAGVALRLNGGASATSNAGGYYTFSGLSIGTYTVTPILSGYFFTPTQRTMTLPLDALNVDFVGTPGVGPDGAQVYLPLATR
ncbi:MAG: right-handed parallel beta-helix repeat-containing protein [Anaerolineales bacterium]|nr:right-handed parallel beta-helix repeat-containing protein [Anaerolineales bacterium]